MEKAATIVCLVMICLSPLGILSALTIRRAAKRQAADRNNATASELRLRSLKYFIRGLLDLVVGGIGYYVVTRRVFPQIDSAWILMVVVLPTALVEIAFQLRLNAQKSQANRVPSN